MAPENHHAALGCMIFFVDELVFNGLQAVEIEALGVLRAVRGSPNGAELILVIEEYILNQIYSIIKPILLNRKDLAYFFVDHGEKDRSKITSNNFIDIL